FDPCRISAQGRNLMRGDAPVQWEECVSPTACVEGQKVPESRLLLSLSAACGAFLRFCVLKAQSGAGVARMKPLLHGTQLPEAHALSD
ncbi:hypothetical protein VXQ18_07780, partial [Brucella abortus]|nr:hypothetical protein [Brucella abortus]